MKQILTLSALLAIASVAFPQTPAAGIDEVDVVKATATVTKIDLPSRKVTLKMDDGKSKTVKVDKSVQNLDQVKVGDHLKMTYAEEIIIVIGKTGETPGAASVGAVGVAPKGAKPGTFMVDTTAMSGKVLAVNAAKYQVTLQEPDGKKKTVKVSKKVQNLNQLKPGDSVDVSVTDALLIEVVK
jgi:translation initiation factor IF-1/Cu/Ag efflux protein CusF